MPTQPFTGAFGPPRPGSSSVGSGGGGGGSSSDTSTYTVFNPVTSNPTIALSNGNLTMASTGSSNTTQATGATAARELGAGGKFYFEFNFQTVTSTQTFVAGIVNTALFNFDNNATGFIGLDNNGISSKPHGEIVTNNNIVGAIDAFASGIMGVAVDLTNELIWFRSPANGHWNGSPTANPATGTGGQSISSLNAGFYAPAASAYNGSGNQSGTLNAGASAFSGALPGGFLPWGPAPPPVGSFDNLTAFNATVAGPLEVGVLPPPSGPHGVLNVTGPVGNGSNAIAFLTGEGAGATAVRFVSYANLLAIEGVDTTSMLAYEPLALNGSQINIQNNGTTTALFSNNGVSGSAFADVVPAGTNAFTSSSVAPSPGVALTGGGATNDITSITLPAGDWLLFGNIGFAPTGGSLTDFQAWITNASASVPNRPNGGAFIESFQAGVSGDPEMRSVGMMHVAPGSSTTYYLSCITHFAATSLVGFGFLGAIPITNRAT